jgi:hypothetical protein
LLFSSQQNFHEIEKKQNAIYFCVFQSTSNCFKKACNNKENTMQTSADTKRGNQRELFCKQTRVAQRQLNNTTKICKSFLYHLLTNFADLALVLRRAHLS